MGNLSAYQDKRDFAQTPEPDDPGHPSGLALRYSMQNHDATRLHWDLRLEWEGVLLSWAVTRGPSLDTADKRLAVRTEDHPLSHATFEGTIPAREYGGGTVMLWDRGTWAPVAGKSAKDLEKGYLHFVVDGERMQGEWLLIRLKPRPGEKRENWLLRKIDDAHAGGSDTLVETALTSVATGRTMQEIADGKKAKKLLPRKGKGTSDAGGGAAAASDSARGKRPSTTASRRSPAPSRGGFRALQLATLVDSVPSGTQWLHEVKYDGYRALVAVGNGKATIFTRTGLDWSDRFPDIARAAAPLRHIALIDGEIVAFKDGRPDFAALQAAIGEGGAMTLFAFDLLSLDGKDLTRLPQVERKERLRGLLAGCDDSIQFAEHVVGAGERLFATMCREGYEGIVSKAIDAPYRGTRSKAWPA